jgi:SAM-dependent methyltransferase
MLKQANRALILVADRLKPVARRLRPFVPMGPLHRWYWKLQTARIGQLEDRVFLERRVVPYLASRRAAQVLFVGCRMYTQHYPALFGAAGMTAWTMDIDPAAEAFGHAGHHRTLDLLDLDDRSFPVVFDAVVLNGVFGYGVDDPGAIDAALGVVARLLRGGATLVVGWNRDRSVDPLTLPAAAAFAPCPLEDGRARIAFDSVTHVYDLLVRRDTAPVMPS